MTEKGLVKRPLAMSLPRNINPLLLIAVTAATRNKKTHSEQLGPAAVLMREKLIVAAPKYITPDMVRGPDGNPNIVYTLNRKAFRNAARGVGIESDEQLVKFYREMMGSSSAWRQGVLDAHSKELDEQGRKFQLGIFKTTKDIKSEQDTEYWDYVNPKTEESGSDDNEVAEEGADREQGMSIGVGKRYERMPIKTGEGKNTGEYELVQVTKKYAFDPHISAEIDDMIDAAILRYPGIDHTVIYDDKGNIKSEDYLFKWRGEGGKSRYQRMVPHVEGQTNEIDWYTYKHRVEEYIDYLINKIKSEEVKGSPALSLDERYALQQMKPSQKEELQRQRDQELANQQGKAKQDKERELEERKKSELDKELSLVNFLKDALDSGKVSISQLTNKSAELMVKHLPEGDSARKQAERVLSLHKELSEFNAQSGLLIEGAKGSKWHKTRPVKPQTQIDAEQERKRVKDIELNKQRAKNQSQADLGVFFEKTFGKGTYKNYWKGFEKWQKSKGGLGTPKEYLEYLLLQKRQAEGAIPSSPPQTTKETPSPISGIVLEDKGQAVSLAFGKYENMIGGIGYDKYKKKIEVPKKGPNWSYDKIIEDFQFDLDGIDKLEFDYLLSFYHGNEPQKLPNFLKEEKNRITPEELLKRKDEIANRSSKKGQNATDVRKKYSDIYETKVKKHEPPSEEVLKFYRENPWALNIQEPAKAERRDPQKEKAQAEEQFKKEWEYRTQQLDKQIPEEQERLRKEKKEEKAIQKHFAGFDIMTNNLASLYFDKWKQLVKSGEEPAGAYENIVNAFRARKDQVGALLPKGETRGDVIVDKVQEFFQSDPFLVQAVFVMDEPANPTQVGGDLKPMIYEHIEGEPQAKYLFKEVMTKLDKLVGETPGFDTWTKSREEKEKQERGWKEAEKERSAQRKVTVEPIIEKRPRQEALRDLEAKWSEVKGQLSSMKPGMDRINLALNFIKSARDAFAQKEEYIKWTQDMIANTPLNDDEKQKIIEMTGSIANLASIDSNIPFTIYAKALWNTMKKKIGNHATIGPKEV